MENKGNFRKPNQPIRKQNQPFRRESPPARKKKRVLSRRPLQRQLLIIFLLSFFISTALIVYVFGMTGDFFSRMFWCLLVIFSLISITVLGIVPAVNWLFNRFLNRLLH